MIELLAKKNKKYQKARLYVVVTQGIITMVILGVGGMFLGINIYKKNYTVGLILSVVGILIGLIYLIITVWNENSDNDKKGL